jgi:hypothetical protein
MRAPRPADLQASSRAVGREGVNPGGACARHPGVGALVVALGDRDPVGVALDRASRFVPVLPDDQDDRPGEPVGGNQTPGEAEDRPEVDRLTGAGRAPRPLIAPACQRSEHGHQLARSVGEPVLDARRHLTETLTGKHPLGHHPVQARAELLGRDPREDALEFDEAPRARGEIANDQ